MASQPELPFSEASRGPCVDRTDHVPHVMVRRQRRPPQKGSARMPTRTVQVIGTRTKGDGVGVPAVTTKPACVENLVR